MDFAIPEKVSVVKILMLEERDPSRVFSPQLRHLLAVSVLPHATADRPVLIRGLITLFNSRHSQLSQPMI